jgi:hypothetical protein
MKITAIYFKNTVFALVTFIFLLVSCKKEDVKVTPQVNEAAGLQQIDSLTQGNYTFYIYKKDTGKLVVGYNEIYIQLKNKATGKFVEDANLSWKPLMHMASMSHACPYSGIDKVPNTNTLYKGYFIFIMASDDMEYWEINYNYIKETDTLAKVSNRPTIVNATGRVRYKSFTGADNVSFYYLALVNPTEPKVGGNEITAYLYKKVDLLTFTQVENYTIKIDPRMPGMGNHTSPNNTNLTNYSGIYKGVLNLTMTGYWKINLIVLDSNNTVVKGETITETNTASSLYFEIEF